MKILNRWPVVVVLTIFSMTQMHCQQSDISLQANPMFVALIVSDMDRSLEWYADVFQCVKIDEVDLKERGIRQANLECTSWKLELIQTSDLKETEDSKLQKGFFKVGLQVTDFDQWVLHAEDNEVEFRGDVVTLNDTNKRTVILLDPDGNRIQLFEK